MFKSGIFILLVAMSLVACSERDLGYYQAHLDDAEKKTVWCENEATEAFKAADKVAVQSILEDIECKAAHQAHREYQRELATLEREKRAQERERIAAEKKAQFDDKYQSEKARLSSLSYEKFVDEGAECGALFVERNPKCKAFKDLRLARKSQEMSALIERLPGDKLSTFSQRVCKGIEYDEGQCILSRDAVQRQHKDKIDYFLANRSQLKKVFNRCHSQYIELYNASKHQEAMDTVRSFECNSVADAARQLKVHNFSKPIS